MASKTVDTTEFELSHGRKPRGYGMWVFATRTAVRAVRGTGQLPADMAQITATYGQAKAQLAAGDWVVMP